MNTNTAKTYEQTWLENKATMPTYAIAACPEWEHFDVEECPAPIRAWVEQHYPDVVIEPLSGLSFENSHSADGKNPDDFLICHLPRPIFRLGFNREQAAHFARAWSTPPLDTPDSPNNFYFMTSDERDLSLSEDEVIFSVTATPGKKQLWEAVVVEGQA